MPERWKEGGGALWIIPLATILAVPVFVGLYRTEDAWTRLPSLGTYISPSLFIESRGGQKDIQLTRRFPFVTHLAGALVLP